MNPTEIISDVINGLKDAQTECPSSLAGIIDKPGVTFAEHRSITTVHFLCRRLYFAVTSGGTRTPLQCITVF